MTRDEKLAILKGDSKKPTREEAIAILKAEEPAKAESNEGISNFLKNIDQALAQGIVKGAVATPGLPGDIQRLLKSAGAHNLPGIGNALEMLPEIPLTSEDTLAAYEQYEQPFKNYTGVPAMAERAGEFFTPTPGGKTKVARDVATSVLGAGGSLGGEAFADKFNVSPEWSSMIGSLLGVGAGQLRRPSTVKIAAADAPSPEQLHTQKDVDYTLAESQTNLDKKAFAETVSAIAKDMKKEGVEHIDEPGLGSKMQRLLDQDQIDFVDLDSLAQRAGDSAVHGKTSKEKRYGNIVSRHISNYYSKLEATHPGIKETVAQAKESGRSNLLSRGVEIARDPAELAKSGEAIGEMDATRAWAKKNWKSLTSLEREAATRATGRATAQSPLRTVGRFLQGAPAKTVQLAALVSAPWAGGMEQAALALGSGGLGMGAERFADAMTTKRLDELEAVLRSGKKGQAEAIKKAAPLKREATQSGLAGLLGAIRSEQIERYERNKNKKPKRLTTE